MDNKDERTGKKYINEFSENGFWDKINGFAKKAGKDVIEKSLCLYYVTKKPETPQWAKATAYGALGYFISPVDAIPDLTPFIGYSDDLGVVAMAIATLAYYIDDEVRKKAKDKTSEWFD